MKFLVFSDIHADLFSDSVERLDKIIESAKENEVDFIVSLGDVCHPVEENVKYLKKLQDSGLKVYHTIGNHDTEYSDIETALKFLGMEKGYYSFESGDYKFIVIDDCYFRTEEGDEHFPNSHKKPCIYPVVPKEELEWLEKELQDNKKYVIFSHISFVHGFEARGIRNREEILALFKGREVLLCMNGHNHGTDLKKIDNTIFYTVNSVTHFSWWEVSSEGVKIMDMPYADPLHVIVELQDSTVRIKGMETYYRKKKPEDAGIMDNVWKGISTLPVAKSYNLEHIALIEVQRKYADDIWKFRKEILECDTEDEDQFAGCLSLDESKSAEEWITICELRKSEETCSKAGVAVPSHTYLAVRKSDDKVVGVIDLRHHINHPILGTWGGHCGYSVRPSERGKGYAKEMLRLNIQNAKEMGIEKLLVTCNVENEASEKTILANGGVYEKTIDVDGCEMKRYWITV